MAFAWPSRTGLFKRVQKAVRPAVRLVQLEDRFAPAVATWDGGSAADAKWSTAANWVGDVLPATGDDLVFPAGANNHANSNDLTGLSVKSIAFTGPSYNVSGNGLTLTGTGIAVNYTPANSSLTQTTFGISLAFAGAQAAVRVDGTNGTSVNQLVLSGTLALPTGMALEFDGVGTAYVNAAIQGTGSIVKNGTGSTYFQKANSYAGTVSVNDGRLVLNSTNGPTITGNLTVGDDVGAPAGATVFETANQIADTATVTVVSDGFFVPNTDDKIAALVLGSAFGGGTVGTLSTAWQPNGKITVTDGVTVNASPTSSRIGCDLDFKSTGGTFNIARGTSPANRDLVIFGVIYGQSDLVLNGTGRTEFGFYNLFSGTTIIPDGTLYLNFDAVNDPRASGNAFSTIPRNLIIGDGDGVPAEVLSLTPYTLFYTCEVTLAGDGRLDMSAATDTAGGEYFASLNSTAPTAKVVLGSGRTLVSPVTKEAVYAGQLTGAGRLVADNYGLQRLTGAVALSGASFGATSFVAQIGGNLSFEGTVVGAGNGVLLSEDSTVYGTATLGTVVSVASSVRPALMPGTPTVPGNLTVGTLNIPHAEIVARLRDTGETGTVTVTGPVTSLGYLKVSLPTGFTPQPGRKFTVVNVSNASYTIPMGARFNGLAEGAAFTDAGGGSKFRITYAGGDGNDVVITEAAAPTVTAARTAGQPLLTNAAPISFDVTFSGPVTGFTASDVVVSAPGVSGTVANVIALDPANGAASKFRVDLTGMIGDGALTVTVPAAAAVGLGGTDSTASTGADNTVAFDSTRPTLSFVTTPSGTVTNAATVGVTVTATEGIFGFTAADVVGQNAAVSNFKALSATTYSFDLAPTGQGLFGVDIPGGVFADGAGNTNLFTDLDRTFDSVAPDVTVAKATGQANPTNGAPIQYTVTFAEPVTGFTAAGVTFAGSTAGGTLAANISGGPSVYTVSVTGMTSSGLVSVGILAAAAKDAAGNNSTAGATTGVAFDNDPPAVAVAPSAGQTNPTNGTISFAVTFAEPVTGFDAADLIFAGSTVGGTPVGTVSGSGANYTVTVTGMTGTGVVSLTVPANKAFDAVGNPNTAALAPGTVQFDGVAPTAVIAPAAGQLSVTNAGPVVFTVTFSELVTGFDAADIGFAGSTVGGTPAANVTGSGTVYTVEVSGMTGSGTVRAVVLSGAAKDAAGNSSTVSTAGTVTYDAVAPTAAVTKAAGQASPTNVGPVAFTVTFSEPVSGFTAADVTTAGSTVVGTLVAAVTGGPSVYTVSVSGMTGTGTVALGVTAATVTDAAGNTNAAAGPATVTFDETPPGVAVVPAAGQASPTNAGPVVFNVTFTEPVTGFTAADVSFAGSTVGGALLAAVSGGPSVYTVSVMGMTGAGVASATVLAGAAMDGSGNATLAAPGAATVQFDAVAPTVIIAPAAGQTSPTNAGPVQFTVTFGEAVTGFTAADLSFPAGLSGTVSGTGPAYTVSVTGMAGTQAVTLDVVAGAVIDAAGNANAAATGPLVQFDVVSSGVTVAAASPSPTNTAPVLFTVTFDEAVAGFTAADVSFAGSTVGGTLTAAVSGGPSVYTVAVSGMTGDGTVDLGVPAGAATDAAGNLSKAGTAAGVTLDSTPPGVTLTTASTTVVNVTVITITAVFTQAVTGFTAADVTVTNGTVTNFSGSGTSYSIVVTAGGQGAVTVTVNAGVGVDAAGNGSTASNGVMVTVDTIAPTAIFTSTAGAVTNVSPIPMVLTFNEPVTGLTLSDLVVVNSTVTNLVAVSATVYTFDLVPTGQGTATVSVAAGVVADAAGNANLRADITHTYDSVAPGVTVAPAAGQANPTGTAPILFTVTFTEPVAEFVAGDLAFVGSTIGGKLVATVSGGATVYTVAVTGMVGGGLVTLGVPVGAATDAVGHASTAGTPATVAFVVAAGGALLAVSDSAAAPTAAPTPIDVLANDTAINGGRLRVTTVGLSANGSAAVAADGKSVSYTSRAGFVGNDSFTYTVTDGIGGTSVATVTVTVTAPPPPVNVAPVAVADAAATAYNTPVAVAVLANDTDADGDALTVVAVGPAANGTAIVAGATVTYTPIPGFRGTDTFTYTVADGNGGTETGTVTVTVAPPVPPAPPVELVGEEEFAVGADVGRATATLYDPDGEPRFSIDAFPGFTGGVRVATADFNGDGVADLIAGTGPGRATRVRVLDGRTQAELFAVDPFEASFTGGVYVTAGDLNGDGVPDLVITPDEGGGPRVDIYSGKGFGRFASFFGIDDANFRGGARAGTGDISGDGRTDLIVVAGFGGGPRVAGFDGTTVPSNAPTRIFGDFFAFEQALRNGIFVTVGDIDGDGFADLIAGGGPGGGPRVTAFGGKALLTNTYDVRANFFGGDTESRGGIRVAVKDLDGDSRADIVVGAGAGAGSRVTGYYGKGVPAAGTPPEAFVFDAFEGFTGGVFVG